MRIDKFLKNSRLIKRRTIAKEACDGGRVSINGRTAKAGTDVEIGDEVTLTMGGKQLKVRVLDVSDSVRKADAAAMYEVIG